VQPVDGRPGPEQLVGEAARVEQLERARVDAERARQVRFAGAALKHRARDAAAARSPARIRPVGPAPTIAASSATPSDNLAPEAARARYPDRQLKAPAMAEDDPG
jgi:hypothetical protein